MGKTLKIISDVVFFTGLVLAGLFLASHLTNRTPFLAYIVSSGSMEPAIKTGSIVLVAPKSTYSTGDIVTFHSQSNNRTTTTHRIISQNQHFVRTAGDANNQPDTSLISPADIVGQVIFSIPYLGYPAALAKTPQGFILLVIIPATIIVYEELKNLFSEFKKIYYRIRRLPSPKNHIPYPIISTKPAIALPIIFALLIPLSLTISYFIDRETSSGNSFTVQTPLPPTPTPTPLPESPTTGGTP